MKNQILLILACFFFINIYGKNVTVKHTVENITVHISSFSYREEINKGIIISEYIKDLSKKYNYSDSIEIFLEMIPSEQPEYLFRDNKNIFLHIKANSFNLLDNLKLIEFAILNKKEIHKKVNFSKILKSPNSNQINEVLLLRVDRPSIFEQLENTSDYSYYFQNNQYKIYNKKTKELLLSVPSIYLFSSITYSRPLIFTNDHEFYYQNLNDELKFISFTGDNKLYEGCKFKELDVFVIFCIVKNKGRDIAVLNLAKDKLVDHLDW